MKSSIVRLLGCLGLSMTMFTTGCAGEAEPSPAEPLDVDLEAATLEQALESMRQIDARLKADPNDAQAWSAAEQLRTRFDELNHLVARVELAEKHAVSFY